MTGWLRQHVQAMRAALAKLAAQRLASLLNALVIGVALALPAGGYAVLENLRGGGAESMGSKLLEDCTGFTRSQVAFWAKLVEQAGLAGKQ